MLVRYTTTDGRFTFDVDATTVKDVFINLGNMCEVFENDNVCGCCDSVKIAPTHREVKKFHYFEKVCLSCGAKLAYGQHQEGGTLFPKRTDENDKPTKTKGWSWWDGSKKVYEKKTKGNKS